MRGQPLAHRKTGGHGALIERRHVRERRRRRRAEEIVEDIHATNDRRRPRGVRRDREHAAVPQQATAPALGCERHAAEAAAVDVGNAVVLRETLVEKGVVRPDQIEHAAILAQHAVEKELGFLPERLAQVVIEVRDTDACSALTASRLRSRSHCPAKLVARLNERRSASILRVCFSSSSGRLSLPRIAASSSSSSGMLLHRKNESREASSRSLMRYDAAGGGVLRIGFDAEQELRVDQHGAQRSPDSRIEISVGPPLAIQRHRPLDLRFRDRPAIGAPHQRRRESSSRTRSSLCGVRAVAGRHTKNRRRLGVSLGAFRRIRSGHRNLIDGGAVRG